IVRMHGECTLGKTANARELHRSKTPLASNWISPATLAIRTGGSRDESPTGRPVFGRLVGGALGRPGRCQLLRRCKIQILPGVLRACFLRVLPSAVPHGDEDLPRGRLRTTAIHLL